MNILKKYKKSKGFTLIEGIMVVAIIGILSLVLIPNVVGVINKNKINAYNGMINSVKTAAKTYVSDNRYTLQNIDCSGNKELSIMCVQVGDLIKEGDLSDNVVNPVTKEEIKDEENVLVTYYCRTKNFDYSYRTPIKSLSDNMSASEYGDGSCTASINFSIDPNSATYNKKNSGSEWYVSDVEVKIEAATSIKDSYKYCIKKNGENSCTYLSKPANDTVILSESGSNYKVCATSDLTGEVCTAPIKIDKTKPTSPKMIATDNIETNNWHKADFTLKLSGSSSISSIKYYYGTANNNITTANASIAMATNTSGTTYYAKACNGAGTCSDVSEYGVKLDKTIPGSITISASDSKSSGSWHTAKFDLNMTSKTTSSISGLTYKYGTSSSSINTEGSSVSISSNTIGTTYYAKLCTGAGNCTATQSYTAKLDATVPGTPTIKSSDSIGSGSTHSNNFTLTFSGQTAPSGINYYYGTSSSSINNLGSSVSVENAQNNTTYYAKACTVAGLCGSYSSYTVKINTTPATPTITTSDGIGSGSWHSNNFYLYFNSSTSGATIYYGTSTSSMNSTGTSIYYSSNTTGRTYYAKACNGSVCSSTASYTILLDNATPSAPTMSASDGIGSGGSHSSEFTMYFSAPTPTSGIDHYEFKTPGYVNDYTTISGNSLSSGYLDGATLNVYAKTCNGVGRCSSDGYYQIVFGSSTRGVYAYYYDDSCNAYYVTTCDSNNVCSYQDDYGNNGQLALDYFYSYNPCGSGGGSSSSDWSVNSYYYDNYCNEYYITTCNNSYCNYSIVNGSYGSGTVNPNSLYASNPCASNVDTYTDYIGGNRCSGGNLYYITYCEPSNSGYCKYTQVNGYSSSGTVARSSLAAASQCSGSSGGSTSYPQKYTNGSTYIWSSPSYGGQNCLVTSSGAYSPSGCSSYSNGAIKSGVAIYIIGETGGYVHFLAPKASGNYTYTQGSLRSMTYNGTSYYEFYMTGYCSGQYCVGSTTR